MTLLYHNNEWIDDDAALFGFNDRLRLGDGVFDTMLVICNDTAPPHFVHADLHLSRILHNAELLGIQPLPRIDALKDSTLKLTQAENIPTGRYALNTLITRGEGKRGVMPPENATPTITMRLSTAPTKFPPIHAIISKTVRRNEGSPLSQIKSCNYGDNILALIEARGKDANEAILLNNAGNITCASAGNIFACIDDRLITPPLKDGVMDGVTRRLLIEKMGAVEQSFDSKTLHNANGFYVTNSIRGVCPALSLDGQQCPPPSIPIDKDFHLE